MHRFYWLIPDELAGCSRPGGPEWPSAAGNGAGAGALGDDLAWLCSKEIGAVLSLTETPLDEAPLAQHGIEALHLPVPDMTAPLPEQFIRALDFIDLQRSMGRPVAIHCKMGQGRTGSILAAYLIRRGMSADDAIARIRAVCPGAVESDEQVRALHLFEQRQDWIV